MSTPQNAVISIMIVISNIASVTPNTLLPANRTLLWYSTSWAVTNEKYMNTSTAADVFPIMRPAADKQLMMIKVRLTASHP